jgi:hypothetical protein
LSKAKPQGHDIIVLEIGADIPGQLREALRPKGYPTHLVSSVKAAAELGTKLPSPMLLIAIDSKSSAATTAVGQLVGTSELHHVPIVLCAKESESIVAELEPVFVLVVPVDHPPTPGAILPVLGHISSAIKMGRLGPVKSTDGVKISSEPIHTPPPAPLNKNTQVIELGKAEEAAWKKLTAQFGTVPEALFLTIGSLGLFSKTVGGEAYAASVTEEDLKRRANLDPRLRPVIEEIALEAGTWGARHLFRCAYLSQCVAVAMKLPEDTVAAVREASVLLAAAIKRTERSLLKLNYLKPEHSNIRRDLASRMKDSAMRTAVELQSPLVGQLIGITAKILCREQGSDQDDLSLAASIVMACEFVDRICYQSGHWNPRSAHYLLRKCKAGELGDYHPSVIACIIKLLSEAIASRTLTMLLGKGLRNNPALLAEAKRVRNEPVQPHERKIPIESLLPGMRLSRPIRAFDGRQILDEDLILDQDLIWRLWQLAAIRPLNAPVVVLDPALMPIE